VGFEAEEPEVVALVDQAAAGDAAAFAALYERFLDPVYRYLFYRTGERSDAEDLTEQVFLRAWEGVGKFRWQGRPFLAWLYRLAHDLHTDHLRRQRATVALDPVVHQGSLVDEHAASQLGRTLDADLLTRALRQLSPDQQQVIVLRFAQGLDTPRIARILDKQEVAVLVLQARALHRLREILSIEGESGAR
jgi:RNA polymerase sigma-70 factor, ECF subfamily